MAKDTDIDKQVARRPTPATGRPFALHPQSASRRDPRRNQQAQEAFHGDRAAAVTALAEISGEHPPSLTRLAQPHRA